MKKFFTILCLCCATVIFMTSCGGGSKSGSSEEKTESSEKISDAVCVTAKENTVVLLTHPSRCEVENTDKGCVITFKTKEGKQAFLIPYQYNLDYYKERYFTANGSYEELQINAGQLFKKDTGFYMKGNVRPYEGAGMTFRLANDKMLTFVAVYLYDKDAVDHCSVKVRHLPMMLTNKQELPIMKSFRRFFYLWIKQNYRLRPILSNSLKTELSKVQESSTSINLYEKEPELCLTLFFCDLFSFF